MRVGLTGTAVWRLTLNEVNERLHIKKEEAQSEVSRLKALAWYTAALHRAKRLPPLDSWMNPPKRMTQAEHDAIGKRVRETAAKMGLRVIE